MEVLFEVEEGSLSNVESNKIVEAIIKTLDSKKAKNIKALKIGDKTIIADYFVICTGTSTTQIRSLTDEVEYQLKKGAVPFVRIEGNDCIDWKVVDVHDVIVHIFTEEARDFYKLEKLWSDAEEVDINSIINL
ncbi:MAG: ribosome silencing factor [Clostridia bacterium]|nr:ribosome silencing factor [Clostridia bacterium]